MKGIFVALALCVVCLLGGQAAWAQASAANPRTYKIQPEDILRIQIYNEQQVLGEVPVARDGTISAPFVGILRVQGKTTDEVEKELVQLYRERLRLREPRVSVIIVRFRVLRASVGGFVQRPGTYEIRTGDTILTLLSQGGGPVPDRADLRRATFRRSGSSERIPIDLHAMLNLGDVSQNYELQDGDELTVPEDTRNRVSIYGQIQRPGVFPFREPMRLSDLIVQAGGEIPTRSLFSKTLIIRERQGLPGQYLRIEANFVRFIRNGDASQNVELKPGDLVFVPETKTPDLNRIGAIVNTIFFFDRFFTQGVFGFRFGG